MLSAESSDGDGAQRLAWTRRWERARELVCELADPCLTQRRDRAGNLWFTLPGASERLLVIGSHLDSVPGGGWLDGTLGVLAGLEVARALHAEREALPWGVAVVDWAGEEGARFGRGLIGSSAFAGTLKARELETLIDADGNRADDVIRAAGVDVAGLDGPDPLAGRIGAYLELHIEQGTQLERAGLAIAPVGGTVGVARDRFRFEGQSTHAGTEPMLARQDPLLAAAEAALAFEALATRADGLATSGRLDVSPGVATAIASRATLYLDLRHHDRGSLEALRADALASAEDCARERGCSVRRESILELAPRDFDGGLLELAGAVCARLAPGAGAPLRSTEPHDAGQIAAVAPAAMLFCASRAGLSHCREEDSEEASIELSVRALHELARAVLARAGQRTSGA
jgi:N-carbamoyl-L-amino-acid hydrolase